MKLVSPRQVAKSGLCIGCGACGVMEWNAYGQYIPVASRDRTVRPSALFSRICPFSPLALSEDALAVELFPEANRTHPSTGRFCSAYAGYVAESDFRMRGSSGGMVTWVLTELMRSGRIDGVAHVRAVANPRADGRLFRYVLSISEDEVRSGAKSRYYPVELSEVLALIRAHPGRYAVVGVPCFVKALQLQRRADPLLRERIAFTLGLFCGHMKSARFVESLAWQMGIPIADVVRCDFRLKDPGRPASWYTACLTLRDGRELRKDWWHLADGDWGAGFFQSSACNFCDDVVAETADMSFGDAWLEPYSSDGRGTNVVVVRSEELDALVTGGIRAKRLELVPVDAPFVEQTQAAGLRQRREGLSYRLTWRRAGIRPRKRVAPAAQSISLRRKLIYRMRAAISAWSHRMFWVARQLRWPGFYIGFARGALIVYHGLAYSRGRLGRLWQSWLR